jgi:hypothetical protein
MTELFCPQPDCKLATSGRCLEGFDPPEKCPFQTQDQKNTEDYSPQSAQELVDLPSGEALTERQAAGVTRSWPTKLIIIAGPYDSGKTTILTSLFEAFQEAPFGNYTFRGSRTLVGFERRCHLGRKESGQETAKTAHTSVREGVVFLHLDLAYRGEMGTDNTNLLLSDISGELFKRLRDANDAVKDIEALGRADHLCIVIDGEKIVNKETRHVARNDSRSILRSIMESGVLNENCVIDMILTKWDVVVEAIQSGNSTDVVDYIDETAKAIRGAASGRKVRIHEVAARPPASAKVPFAHGLPTLLRSWMDHEPVEASKQAVYTLVNPRREFNRYTDVVLARNDLAETYDISHI